MRLDRRELPLEAEHAGRNQRFFGEETGIVDQEPCCEVVGSVEHDIVLRDERKNIVRIDQLVIGVDRNLRVDR